MEMAAGECASRMGESGRAIVSALVALAFEGGVCAGRGAIWAALCAGRWSFRRCCFSYRALSSILLSSSCSWYKALSSSSVFVLRPRKLDAVCQYLCFLTSNTCFTSIKVQLLTRHTSPHSLCGIRCVAERARCIEYECCDWEYKQWDRYNEKCCGCRCMI